MIEFHSMFMTQIFLISLMLIGVFTAKVRIVDERSRSSISSLVLDVFMPFTIIASFFDTDRSQLPSMGLMLLISLGNMLLCFVLSRLLYRRAGVEQRKVLLYATIVSNAVMLGTPVVESIYGLEGLPYVAAYMLPLRIAIWTVGLAVFTGKGGSLKTVILHPCLVATYLGIIVMATGFTPPALLSRLCFSLGACTTPLSMIVACNILAQVDPRKILTKMSIYFTFIRLILIPFMIMGFFLVSRVFLRPDPMVSAITVILASMPAGVTTSIMADRFGGDKELASMIIFVSTVLSMITAPLLALFLVRAL